MIEEETKIIFRSKMVLHVLLAFLSSPALLLAFLGGCGVLLSLPSPSAAGPNGGGSGSGSGRERRDALKTLEEFTRGITRDFNMNMEFQLRKLGIKLDDIGECTEGKK